MQKREEQKAKKNDRKMKTRESTMEIGEIKASGKAMMAREGWISRLRFGYDKKVLCKVLKHYFNVGCYQGREDFRKRGLG